jgi:transposase
MITTFFKILENNNIKSFKELKKLKWNQIVKIINEVLLNCKSTEQVAKKYDISGGMLRGWIIKYNKEGLDALENKKKPGNPLSKFSNRKNLSDMEKLQYENMKLRIENERLKKGYLVKGDGSVVAFKK